ncbi:MAG: hypothetical protein EXS08_05200 [Planctomycetes bacterium]|nr:hypothetical protein [Planctomycetota bacterium]
MRPTLALALVLLLLTLALNQSRRLFPRPSGPAALADRALELVAGAKGTLLPAARIGSGPERIASAIRLGERTLPFGGEGLFAAFVGADDEIRVTRSFDLAHAPLAVGELAEALEQAEFGELLVLISGGRCAPAEAQREELARVLLTLGARAPLGSARPESWALLALRLEAGWVPLAEGYSRDEGVALAFVLGADREAYADFRCERVFVPGGARSEMALEDELAQATLCSEGVEFALERTVLGRPLAGLLVPPRTDADGRAQRARVVWADVPIGAGAGILAWVGLADGAEVGDGALCEVRVDGQLVQSLRVLPGAPWKVLLADLQPFARRRVTLELAVEPGASTRGDLLLFGRPTLFQGYDRSPLEVWAEGR